MVFVRTRLNSRVYFFFLSFFCGNRDLRCVGLSSSKKLNVLNVRPLFLCYDDSS